MLLASAVSGIRAMGSTTSAGSAGPIPASRSQGSALRLIQSGTQGHKGNSKLKKASQQVVHGERLVPVARSWEAEGGRGQHYAAGD